MLPSKPSRTAASKGSSDHTLWRPETAVSASAATASRWSWRSGQHPRYGELVDIEARFEAAPLARCGDRQLAFDVAAVDVQRQPVERDLLAVDGDVERAGDGQSVQPQWRRQPGERGEAAAVGGFDVEVASGRVAGFCEDKASAEIEREIAGLDRCERHHALAGHAGRPHQHAA